MTNPFPALPADVRELPEIPGGWEIRELELSGQVARIRLPADPDLFLDREEVVKRNAETGYMPYWTYLWPSAVTMANCLHWAPWTIGTPVLEVGAGLGVVGLAAQLRGDVVTYSDYDPTALHVCRHNAVLNNLTDPEVLSFDWRDPPPRRFPVIIGCEVTYDAEQHVMLLDLFDRLLTAEGVIWLADPGRSQSPVFSQLAQQRGYAIRILNAQGEALAAPSVAEFQLFEMRRV